MNEMNIRATKLYTMYSASTKHRTLEGRNFAVRHRQIHKMLDDNKSYKHEPGQMVAVEMPMVNHAHQPELPFASAFATTF